MQNKKNDRIKKIGKATVSNIMVAFLFVLAMYICTNIFLGETLTKAMALINIISVQKSNIEPVKVSINEAGTKLKSYPAYGDKYGTIKIDKIGVFLPLYYGDSLDILKKGIGHSSGSYFPGEGGSIISMGHDTAGFLKYLYTIKVGDQILIETNYGKFTYEIYQTKIVRQTQTDAVYVQSEEEILMLYTCYPSNSIGHATHRFITYSKLIDKEIY